MRALNGKLRIDLRITLDYQMNYKEDYTHLWRALKVRTIVPRDDLDSATNREFLLAGKHEELNARP